MDPYTAWRMKRLRKMETQYASLQRRMTNLQQDHASLLQDAENNRRKNPSYSRTQAQTAARVRADIDATVNEIQRLGPKLGKAREWAARRDHARAKGSANKLRTLDSLHAAQRSTIGVNWGSPPSRIKGAWTAFRARFSRRKAA